MRANLLGPFRTNSEFCCKRFVQFAVAGVCALLLSACNSVTQNSSATSAQNYKVIASSPLISLQSALPTPTVGTPYNSAISVSGGSAPYSFWVSAGQLPEGLALNSTTGGISGTPMRASQLAFSISVRGADQSFGVHDYAITVGNCDKCISVQISPANPSTTPGGKVQFSASVTNTSNTAVTWSASAGTIASTGMFTAPSTTPTNAITVTATSAAQSSAVSSTVVSIGSTELTITTSSLPSGQVGSAYDGQLTASGGTPPYTWSIASGSLPPGLQLQPASGAITGTPTKSGTFDLTFAVADAASHTAQQSIAMSISSQQSNCGPPSYCSRTDQKIVQLPPSPPKVGSLIGANTITTDPDFSNTIVRITDYNTNPSAATGSSRTYVSATSGSADENLWNTDSTLFIVQDNNGGAYPFSFNPSTMQASRLYVSSEASTGGMTLSDSGEWSRVNSNVLYQTTGTSIVQYDFSNRSVVPSPQTVYNFAAEANCLPSGFSETWASRGGVSAGDTTFAEAYSNKGDQGTGVYAVVYKVGSGCIVLNTQTGQVSGQWGTKGTINIPDRWTIHNVKISKDGNWLIVAPQYCTSSSCEVGPYFWELGTTNVLSCGDVGHCGGHWTEGYTHWVNNDNSPLSNEVFRAFPGTTTSNLITSIPTGIVTPFDQHQSWNNADPNDSVPFLAATWSTVSPFPSAWYNEIVAVAGDGSGTVWRFAHSFITGRSQVFSSEYAIGSVSQDGRFFLFSSDWMGTLGSETGSENCTVGSNCRGDVFVVQLN